MQGHKCRGKIYLSIYIVLLGVETDNVSVARDQPNARAIVFIRYVSPPYN